MHMYSGEWYNCGQLNYSIIATADSAASVVSKIYYEE